VRERTALSVVVLALLLFLAPLVKATNFLFVLIPLVTILFLLPRSEWRAGLVRVAPSLLASLLILVTLYFAESATYQVGEKTIAGGSFTSIKKVILSNISKAANWYWLLLTPPLAILAVISVIWAFAARSREAWFLLALFLLPTLPYILFATIWFPRYLAFSLVPLALLLAQLWTCLEKKMASTNISVQRVHLLSALILGVLLLWPFLYTVRLVHRPDSTPLPETISWQFIRGWPSGYGSKELSSFLVARADEAAEEVYVLHPAYWSQTNVGLKVHLPADPGLELVDIGHNIPSELELGAERLKGGSQILFVIDSTRRESVALLNTIQPLTEMERIWHHPKPSAAAGLEVWQVEQILTNDD
jgi:hypothetical protein